MVHETTATLFIVGQIVVSVAYHDAVRWPVWTRGEGMKWPFPPGGERRYAEGKKKGMNRAVVVSATSDTALCR
jgi:hypothetical protein